MQIIYNKETKDGKFKQYLEISYHNLNTRRQYQLRESHFIRKFFKEDEPLELTQEKIDDYLIWFKNKTGGNILYSNFIKAYLNCYDPEGNFRLKILKSKSRKIDIKKEYKSVDRNTIDLMINKLWSSDVTTHKQLAVMLAIYFDTGLRAHELLNIDRSIEKHPAQVLNKIKYPYGWNIDERVIWGIGKNYKPFKVRYSQKTADMFAEWMTLCFNKDKPFSFYFSYDRFKKHHNEEVKNPYHKLWYDLNLVSKAITDKNITPHMIRHSLGYFLRKEKHWDIMQIKKKLRHASVTSTEIYTPATTEEIESLEDETLFEDKEPKIDIEYNPEDNVNN